MAFNKDEYEFLHHMIGFELKSIRGQLDWSKRHEPGNKEAINTKKCYIDRLVSLRKKLNDSILGEGVK